MSKTYQSKKEYDSVEDYNRTKNRDSAMNKYIGQYTSGHSDAQKMKEMYDNPQNYTYEEFRDQLGKAKYAPKQNDAGDFHHSPKYGGAGSGEEFNSTKFNADMGAYSGTKATLLADFESRKRKQGDKNLQTEIDNLPSPGETDIEEADKEGSVDVKPSDWIMDARARTQEYERRQKERRESMSSDVYMGGSQDFDEKTGDYKPGAKSLPGPEKSAEDKSTTPEQDSQNFLDNYRLNLDEVKSRISPTEEIEFSNPATDEEDDEDRIVRGVRQ